MHVDWVRRYCMSLPHVTEQVQWESLVFKIGGRMFALAALEPHEHGISHCMTLKCSAESFAELVERPGIVPAPYLARAHWVALESFDAIARPELERMLSRAYEMVFAKLPKKAQAELRKPPKTKR
ncbi:MAG TPA: MmcQ/YjbR family DNA-binding protein [Bryobacteraceae bacterium]|nr:MmcQ/YjbR family DNA-binding protein [Bryobacteraceae bacterium]